MEDVSAEIPEDRRQAAVDAKRFKDDPTTARVMAMITAHYMREMLASAPGDTAGREHCYRQMLAVQDFGKNLTKLATSGTLEERRRNQSGGNGIA